ncbi:hypothetical protein [Candidatus Viridilinea mediisalina]|uniref:Uncharacterized protein n=1 Tax=Candidatus Viridilinea mediisalina TaxID=2024553 RepID=A0A2A6RCX1_9CHLR|nr:hypothetical protein [Candidatus Viridilinea mediisalina]PDV99142.1 hypothetical protein CJ255_21700 [Candidatus Viridilinea mediisalina]
MATREPPTFAQVLTWATCLPPVDKLRIIERLVPQVAQVLPLATQEAMQPSTVLHGDGEEDAWDALLRLGDEPTNPPGRDSAIVLRCSAT